MRTCVLAVAIHNCVGTNDDGRGSSAIPTIFDTSLEKYATLFLREPEWTENNLTPNIK